MKSRTYTFIGILISFAFAQLQAQSYVDQLLPEIVRVDNYFIPSLTNPALVYQMDFASAIINKAERAGQKEQGFRQVDLVFTLYPRDPDTWKVGYDNLMEARFRRLEQRIPALFQDKEIKWRLVIQTDCNSLAQAKSMFHGFVLYPKMSFELRKLSIEDTVAEWEPFGIDTMAIDEAATETELEPMPPRFDSLDLQENLDQIQQIIEGDISHHDSTVIEVFERHPEWKNALVVIDWTASMYRQGALLIAWQQDHRHENRIRHFVFFNDGDGKYDDEKIIGATGGVYETPADTLPKMLPAIEGVTMGGEGGDHRENDIEALLQGLSSCPDCNQVILIADNTGPVRDLSLLKNIDVPIKILLCRSYKDVIEPDYLTIADRTNGSLHTKTRDLENIEEMMVKGILKIGEEEYAKPYGRFRKHKPRL